MRKIKVMIAEDHDVIRQGLKILIESGEDMEVTGEAGNGQEAVQLAGKLNPDVVLMDLAMPRLNGLEATKKILEKQPASKVLVLSSYSDDDSVRGMLDAGAVGYVTKHAASEDLLKAIREVSAGNSYFSPRVAQKLRRQSQNQLLRGGTRSTRLTPREEQVLRCVACGMPNKEVAAELGISTKTVEKHRQQVMNKLDTHEIAGLTRYAISKGLIQSAVVNTQPQAVI